MKAMVVNGEITVPGGLDDVDQLLIASVEREALVPEFESMSVEALRAIAERRGVDVATAAAFASLRGSRRHGWFIRAIDAGQCPVVEGCPTLVVVPGAFYRHHAETGADGGRLLKLGMEFGWPVERVGVGSLGSLESNARAIVEHLSASGAERVVLASLSKGSADVAFALKRFPDAFDRVVGWLDLSGLVFGTALIRWLRGQRLRTMGVHLLLWSKGLRFGPLDELSRSSTGPLGGAPPLPAHMKAIHVVGFPLRKHLRHPWAPRGYERVLPMGPNDGGGVLLGDVGRLPGLVYPVWGADHYLNPSWEFGPVLRSVFLHAAASANTATAMPATRSST